MWIETKRGEMWNFVIEDEPFIRLAAYPRAEHEDPFDSFSCGLTLKIFNTRAEADAFFKQFVAKYLKEAG